MHATVVRREQKVRTRRAAGADSCGHASRSARKVKPRLSTVEKTRAIAARWVQFPAPQGLPWQEMHATVLRRERKVRTRLPVVGAYEGHDRRGPAGVPTLSVCIAKSCIEHIVRATSAHAVLLTESATMSGHARVGEHR